MRRPRPNEAQPSSETDFEARLRQLRQAWRERREVARLVHSGDAASQVELLQRIHSWAVDCVDAINRVYGSDLAVNLSPSPGGDADGSFVLTVAHSYRLAFSVVPRSGGGWRIAARNLSGMAAGSATAVGPSRRDGSWTRARVEDLILAQVAAVERSRGEDQPPLPAAISR
jgi:hypothetical protein